MGKKRLLPLQPAHSTPYYAFLYLTVFFVCISKSYWMSFTIPYAVIHVIVDIIIRINIIKSTDGSQSKTYGQNRDYWTFVFVSALEYICIWQSMYSPSYNTLDHIILYLFLYSHFCVLLQFMHFHLNLFAKFKVYRICIGWIAELHYTTILCTLYIFPVYPITAYYIEHDVIDPMHKYALFIVYILLYYYTLYSLFLSLNTSDANTWTYFKIDYDPTHEISHKTKHTLKPLKFEQYYVGNKMNHKHNVRICQITDCHLDSIWSANELRALCRNIVSFDPDLVLLTGDFYYTKNEDIPKGLLKYALTPLSAIAHKCYACLGNHELKTKKSKNDIEKCVLLELRKLNIKLLRNESVLHNEYAEVIGFDFVKHNTGNKRANMMKAVLKQSKLKNKGLRIVLLHNPEHFDDFDGDESIIAFSGHVHGGHVGFYVLGSVLFPCFRNTSLYRMLHGWIDYGVWEKGSNSMYVHRGNTLHAKGFLRFGVPAEQQSCIVIRKQQHN